MPASDRSRFSPVSDACPIVNASSMRREMADLAMMAGDSQRNRRHGEFRGLRAMRGQPDFRYIVVGKRTGSKLDFQTALRHKLRMGGTLFHRVTGVPLG